MKKITWKQALWFVVAFALLSAMYEAIKPLIPLNDIKEAKIPFQTMVDITEKEQIKKETIDKKDIDKLEIDIKKSTPKTEIDKELLKITELYKDFKAADVTHSTKLNNLIAKNNVDDAFTIETYKSLVLIDKYINSYENILNASIEYKQSYLKNIDRMVKKAKVTLSKEGMTGFNKGYTRTQTKALRLLDSGIITYQVSLELLKKIKQININNFFLFENGDFYIQDDRSLEKFNLLIEKQNEAIFTYNKNIEEFERYMKQIIKEGKDFIK